jgi:protease I
MRRWVSLLLVVVFLVQILALGMLYRREEVIWVPGKKVLMVVAPENFRYEELFDTRNELEKAGIEVKVASTTKGIVRAMFNAGTVRPDFTLDEVEVENWDAIVFVGGTGCQVYFDNEQALSLARAAAEKGKKVCAICIAPVILANAGLLENRKATVWDDVFKEMLENKGAKYVNKSVVVDGNFITANGPEAAKEFGRTIAKQLK